MQLVNFHEAVSYLLLSILFTVLINSDLILVCKDGFFYRWNKWGAINKPVQAETVAGELG